MKEEQIIESARELFYKYGFKRVSMDEIANNARVTKKTVYSYFTNKEELLKFFVTEEIQNMKKIVEEIEKENLPYFDNVHKVLCELLKYKKSRNFLNIILEEAESFKNPVVIENLKSVDETIRCYIEDKINYAEKQGYIEVPSAKVTAFLVYRLYLSLIMDFNDENFDEEIIADNIIKIIRNGIERKDNNNENQTT